MPNTRPAFGTPQDYLRQADQDRALLRRIASGDEDAIGALYDYYAPLLAAEAVRMLRSVADAEDVLQEVFLEVWKDALKGPEGTTASRLVSYARARSLLRTRARGHRRGHHPLDEGGSPSLRESGALGYGPDAAKGNVFERSAAALPGEAQKTLALAFYEGLSVTEIAELLAKPQGEVLTLLGGALIALHRGATVARFAGCSKNAEFPLAAAASALGALDGEAGERFQTHLQQGCSTCSQDMAGLRETSSLLPFLLPQAPLAPDVKERILFAIRLSIVASADVDGTPAPTESAVPERGHQGVAAPSSPADTEPAARPVERPWLILAGVFAGLVLLIGLAAYINTLIEKVDEQATFIQDQENAMARLTTDMDWRKAVLGIIESPSLEVVGLKGVGEFAGAHGKIFWDTARDEAVLQVSEVADPKGAEEFRLQIIARGADTIQIPLLAIDDSDSSRSYFGVRGLPHPAKDRAVGVELVRATRGQASRGQLLMVGVTAHEPGGVTGRNN